MADEIEGGVGKSEWMRGHVEVRDGDLCVSRECMACAGSLCWRCVTWAALAASAWVGVSVGYRLMRAVWMAVGL